MNIWVNLATLIAGVAAVVAIVIGVLDRRRQEYADDVAHAAGITAWQGYADGEGGRLPGVIVENRSGEVAIDVDLKAGVLRRAPSGVFASEADESPGLRLALLPTGTWFVPLSDEEGWQAQLEVDDADGARRVAVPESDRPDAARLPYQIVPEARVREGVATVQLLRFVLSAGTWWRDERGVLHEQGSWRPWRRLRRPAPTTWDAEFTESASSERVEAVARADFSKYGWQADGRRHGKFDTINLIAGWWAKQQGIGTRAEFERAFGDELCRAVPSLAASFDAAALLTASAAKDKNDGNPKELHIELDGRRYGIRWTCGFKAVPQLGLAVHRPIIEHFVRKHDAPAVPLG